MLLDIDDANTVELRLKILIIGQSFAGKTSFIERYVNNKFIHAYKPTIGVDFGLKTIQWDYSTKIVLQLYDSAGQNNFWSRVYYKNAVGSLILFDINCSKSFISVLEWKKQLDDLVLLPNGNSIPCILVGNKCDVEPTEVSVLPSLSQFCKVNKFCGYYLSSAKENINVNEAMHFLVEQIVSNKEITENLLKKKTMSREVVIDKKSTIVSRCC